MSLTLEKKIRVLFWRILFYRNGWNEINFKDAKAKERHVLLLRICDGWNCQLCIECEKKILGFGHYICDAWTLFSRVLGSAIPFPGPSRPFLCFSGRHDSNLDPWHNPKLLICLIYACNLRVHFEFLIVLADISVISSIVPRTQTVLLDKK